MKKNIRSITIDFESKKRSLLEIFIYEKLTHYDEPQRLGVPRGKAIGLSLKKFNATLAFLYHLEIKKTSENMGLSYGLLLKWRTEKLFKQTIEKHRRDFYSFLEEYVEKLLVQTKKVKKRSHNKPDQKDKAVEFMAAEIEKKFQDSKLYSTELLDTVYSFLGCKILHAFSKKDRYHLKYCILVLIRNKFDLKKEDLPSGLTKRVMILDAIENKFKIAIWKSIAKEFAGIILNNKNISKENRSFAGDVARVEEDLFKGKSSQVGSKRNKY